MSSQTTIKTALLGLLAVGSFGAAATAGTAGVEGLLSGLLEHALLLA